MIFPALNKNLIVAIVLAIFAGAAIWFGVRIGHKQQAKETVSWQVKYDSEHQALQKMSDNNQAYAQAAAHTISQEQFKDLFASEFQLFSKNFKLKDIEHYTDVQTVTTHNIKTTLRDSITRDTLHVKAFAYKDANLQFEGYTRNDSLYATYKHSLQLKIATGKEARKGLWRKLTLQPIRRTPIVQAIASDSNTIITNIQSITIK